MTYETVIGLEVHVELQTKSKIFCPCPTTFGQEPNTNVCPVCLGFPGVLPVLNEEAIRLAVTVALALNCEISPYSKFDRKNYFYPDLPKAYQISQFDLPLAEKGYLEIEGEDGTPRRIGITRVHLEEDAGKLIHAEVGDYSLVDYNRTGVPLLEIVSEPDLRSPAEARAYLEKLKSLIRYTGASDCKMEEGSLRCDANISLRTAGTTAFGTKAELKNMNSFRAVQRGLEYEQQRQAEALNRGERIVQETRRWDESKGITLLMRSKEEAHDYRYFPEPDLVPVELDAGTVEEIRSSLPELPDARRRRYMEEYGLSAYDAGVLTASRSLADFFQEAVEGYGEAKTVANWIMGDISRLLNAANKEIEETPLTPAHLVELLILMDKGTISGKIAKEVLAEAFKTAKTPAEIVKEKGLEQISDTGQLDEVIRKVIADNPGPVEDYRQGKKKALGFLVGMVMKETGGKANPQLVNQLLTKELA